MISIRAGLAIGLLLGFAEAPLAATVGVSCASGDVISGSAGPVTYAYEGDASGTLTVRSPTGQFVLPATFMTDGETTSIKGSGKTSAPMPDLAALEACIAQKRDPKDPDGYLNARDACLASTSIAKGPVDIKGWVNIGIMRGLEPDKPGIMIEVKLTYAAKTSGPGGATSIESYPAKCSVSK
jgi:hypothetical protein